VESAVRREKRGTLRSGKGQGGKVTSRKQALGIGSSEARRKGAKVPAKRPDEVVKPGFLFARHWSILTSFAIR